MRWVASWHPASAGAGRPPVPGGARQVWPGDPLLWVAGQWDWWEVRTCHIPGFHLAAFGACLATDTELAAPGPAGGPSDPQRTTMRTLQPREGVVFQTTEHGAVLLDVTTGQFYGLNPVAAAAWTALARAGTIEDVVAAVLDCFDSDEGAARTDVNGLITALRSRGLLSSTP